MIKRSFLYKVFKNIEERLPSFVLSTIYSLIPFYLVSTILEIFGLFILFPVINIVINPDSIRENEYLSSLYNFLSFQNEISFALFLFAIVLTTFTVKNVIYYFLQKKQTETIFNLATRLAYSKFKSYLKQDFTFHTNANPAILLRNFAQIPFELVLYEIIPFAGILNEILLMTILIGSLAFIQPFLFLTVVLLIFPFLFFYGLYYKKRLKAISDRRDIESSFVYKTGLQSMEGYREIRLYNKSSYFLPKFYNSLKKFSSTMGHVNLLNNYSPKLIETVAVASVFSLFLGGYFIGMNLTQLGQFLLLYAIAAYRIIPSINKVVLYSNYINSSFFTFDSFDKKVDSNKSYGEHRIPQEPLTFNNSIEFRELSFAYDNRKPIIDKFSLKIEKTACIGIVGESGGGKTTLLNILLRLHKETAGGIYVDGIKLTAAHFDAWHKLIGYVPQNIFLIDDSIRNNIAFGVPDSEINEKKLNEAITRSQLKSFIDSLPEKDKTHIGEKGMKISGGQRQRIGIARALYHQGEILILDEATSSLDHETERAFIETVNELANGRLTVIMVAHRKETLKYCSRIYKLKKGSLEEDLMFENINSPLNTR